MPPPTLGARFVNLSDPELNRDDPGSPELAGTASIVQRIVDTIAHFSDGGPFTLYIARDATLDGGARTTLTIPAQAALVLAPGARLILAPGLRLVIRGPTEPGLWPRFVLGAGAEVQLLGDIDGIRPEWWRDGEDRDAEAVEAAVAAIARRIEARIPAVPLKLYGPYRLRRAVVIHSRSAGAEIELRAEGRHPVGDDAIAATFVWQKDVRPDNALLHVGAGVRVVMTRVGFDARVTEDLLDGPGPFGVALFGVVDGTTFDRCTFLSRQGGALWAWARSPVRDDGPIERLELTDCWVACQDGARWDVIAIEVSDTGPLALSLDACTFRGDAWAFVGMPVGSLEAVNCDVVNRAEIGVQKVPLQTDSNKTTKLPASGVQADFLVGRAALRIEPRHLWKPSSEGRVSVLVTHHRSGSRQLLLGEVQAGGEVGNVVLTNVLHDTSAGTPDPVDVSIAWRGRLGLNGVVLVGCQLGRQVDLREVVLNQRLNNGGSRLHAVLPMASESRLAGEP